MKKRRDEHNSIWGDGHRFYSQCKECWQHMSFWRRVKEEWMDFDHWWRDPSNRSRQPHFRLPARSLYEMLPLEYDPLGIQRSATMPASFLNLHNEQRNPSTVSTSETMLSPLLPSTSTLTPPQRAAGNHGSPNEQVLGQDAVQRHPYERRPSVL